MGYVQCVFYLLYVQDFSLTMFQVCTNMNKCYCNSGWAGPECSQETAITTTENSIVTITQDPSIKMERKETPYGELTTFFLFFSSFVIMIPQ